MINLEKIECQPLPPLKTPAHFHQPLLEIVQKQLKFIAPPPFKKTRVERVLSSDWLLHRPHTFFGHAKILKYITNVMMYTHWTCLLETCATWRQNREKVGGTNWWSSLVRMSESSFSKGATSRTKFLHWRYLRSRLRVFDF